MESKKVKQGKRNVFFSLGSSLILIALGFVVPRFVVVSYGSEVNGLLSSTTQLLTYLALLESGLASIMRNSLYGELASGNRENVSAIFTAGTSYYRKVSVYYGLCLFVASVIFTVAIDSKIPRTTVFLVVMLSGMSSVISFNFLSSIKNVIEADGNYYFITILDLVGRSLNHIITIVAAIYGFDIVIIKLLMLLATVLVIAIYRIYFSRNYGWINKKEKPQLERFKQRKFYVAHQIASLLFSTTDVILLTFIENLIVVSIYTLYNTIFSAIQMLMNAISSSLVFSLGQTYSEDIKKYYKLHDAFKCFYIQVNFILITVCYFVLIPFIQLYMKNVDVNYADDHLALLFCIISLLNCSRMLDNNLAARTFKMKETMHHVIIEAVLNVVVSVSLIWSLGMYGVLIGTCVAVLFRLIVAPYYSEKHILHRPIIYGYKHAIVNWCVFGVLSLIRQNVRIVAESYLELIAYAIIVGIATLFVYFVVNGVAFRQEYRYFAMILFPQKYKAKESTTE